jgi:antirestriction protein ArdC
LGTLRPRDRDLKNRFGSRDYAAEELVTELGAAFLRAEFGFDGDVCHPGYLAKWIELLKTDKRAFFTACNKASTHTCDDCHDRKMAGYRPDVLTDPSYWTDEPIDED